MQHTLKLILNNQVEEIPRLAEAVEDFCDQAGIAAKLCFNLNLALDELLTNTILYGFAPGSEHQIEVQLAISNNTFTVNIRDDGVAFDPFSEAPPPGLDIPVEDRPIGGLGVYLVKTLIAEYHYERLEGFNQITLHQPLA